MEDNDRSDIGTRDKIFINLEPVAAGIKTSTIKNEYT